MEKLLLSDVSRIHDKYEKLSNLTGDKFNIFKLLGVLTKEVSLHSKFISELLNPKGTHCQEATFLNLFLKRFGLEGKFDLKNTKVLTEFYLGRISSNYSRGGFVDILIRDESRAILIENKIYAKDQMMQLARYYNYAKGNYKDVKIFYLTLDGDNPSDASKGEYSIPVEYISYRTDILGWMEECKEKAVNHPLLRETISQYIGGIKMLTNQTSNKFMANEIIESVLQDTERLKSYFALQRKDVETGVKKELLFRFKNQMLELANEFDLRPEFDDQFGLVKQPTYLKFYFKDSSKGFYISLCFCSWAKWFVLQLDCNNHERDNCREEVLRLLPDRDDKFNEIWIKWFEGNLKDWDANVEPWLMIATGELKSNINTKFSTIISCLAEYRK